MQWLFGFFRVAHGGQEGAEVTLSFFFFFFFFFFSFSYSYYKVEAISGLMKCSLYEVLSV